MKTILIIVIYVWSIFGKALFFTIHNSPPNRDIEIQNEASMRFGYQLIGNFTQKEKMANDLIQKLHKESVDGGIQDINKFPAAMHFFNAKPLINRSRMFKIIRKMPKGAFLHGHNTAMVSADWILQNITYRPGLKMCKNVMNVVLLSFKKSNSNCVTPFVQVSEERAKSKNITEFDMNLKKLFDLYTEHPEVEYPDMNTVWAKFDSMFETLADVVRYAPVFIDFHNRLLEELFEDNIMYAEIRSSLGNLFDDEREYIDGEVIKMLNDVIESFKITHPKFIGAKIIYATFRQISQEKLQEKIERYWRLHETNPDLIIGFDLVGQEDFGEPLKKFLPQLLKLSQETNLFFHAGETNWYGTSTDLNILDAILLRTKRIGHGFSLVKHPVLWKYLKEHQIAIELNPISNQVLGLVKDLRNHPGAVFVAENLPIIVSSDDPGFWRAAGLSYDFYYAFMAFAPYDAGLEILKQLVLNSLKFSVLTETEMSRAYILFDEQWNLFINDLVDGKIV